MNYCWNKLHTCCFIGHRKIAESENIEKILHTIIENLIRTKNINTFIFGSKSEFNSLCLKVITELKEKYPTLRRIYIRAEYYEIDDDYEKYLLEMYDGSIYPEKIKNAGKAVYVERNRFMIDKSNYGIFYYDDTYYPTRRKSEGFVTADHKLKSGTKIAYEYALKKGIKIINITRYSE